MGYDIGGKVIKIFLAILAISIVAAICLTVLVTVLL